MTNFIKNHVKTMADACQENMQRLEDEEVIGAGDLVAMYKDQVELEQAYQWLLRVEPGQEPA